MSRINQFQKLFSTFPLGLVYNYKNWLLAKSIFKRWVPYFMHVTLSLSILAAGLYGLASIISILSFFRAASSGEKKSLCLAAAGALCLGAILIFSAVHVTPFSHFYPFWGTYVLLSVDYRDFLIRFDPS